MTLGQTVTNLDADAVEHDRGLMAAAQRDPTAFSALYRRHLNRVYRYFRYRVGNEEDAQDLTTQTFMAALESLQSYRSEGTVAAWLLGIAHHKFVDWQRKMQPTVSLDAAVTVPDVTQLPDEQVAHHLDRETLEQTLLTLAPERAEAIALRYFGDLSNREVAALMGKNEAAVKMLIHRGLQDLRLRCAPQFESAYAFTKEEQPI
ncbi:MAG: RNA polymerase sigma factor [Caldilineaceae bacterium]|nr:RNA polymerase sigma factor [Caldilineaceae bacterium]